jgi:hypothetical protein
MFYADSNTVFIKAFKYLYIQIDLTILFYKNKYNSSNTLILQQSFAIQNNLNL